MGFRVLRKISYRYLLLVILFGADFVWRIFVTIRDIAKFNSENSFYSSPLLNIDGIVSIVLISSVVCLGLRLKTAKLLFLSGVVLLVLDRGYYCVLERFCDRYDLLLIGVGGILYLILYVIFNSLFRENHR
jgi:hypothetical protein